MGEEGNRIENRIFFLALLDHSRSRVHLALAYVDVFQRLCTGYDGGGGGEDDDDNKLKMEGLRRLTNI